jgi:hypothetical protein
MSDRELVDKSELIVDAVYLGKSVIRFPGMAHRKLVGVLKVDHVYKGNRYEIVLLSLPLHPENVSVSTELSYSIGQNGIWFLKLDSNSIGVFLADHPQRFWHSDQKTRLMNLLTSVLR